MFNKRNYALSPWRSVVKVMSPWRSIATIGSIALLLAACTDYSQKFEEEYEFGPGADRASGLDGDTLTDFRDNFTYSVRKVGNLWWMMDDLAHPYFTDEAYKGTYCYKDKEGVCDETGRLYPGEYLEKACPKGWRLPSLEEWTAFFNSKAFREYTPRHDGASDLYKGYVDGEHTLNGYGEDAYYWTNSHYFSDSYIDCVHFKRDYSSSGGIEPDYSSLSTAELCHEQWKLAVRCVYDSGEEITKSSSSLSMEEKFSSIFSSSSSSIYTTNTSSSNISSSSSVYTTSTSSSNTSSSSFVIQCGDLWCGATDEVGKVETGSENEETAGYWYDCNDAGKDHTGSSLPFCESEKGSSVFEFPADVEPNVYGYLFGPLIEAYGGVKGNVFLNDGFQYPYAYLAFNLVSEGLEGMDISNWDGICLVYESTIGFYIELVPENEQDITEYNNYKAGVAKSSSVSSFDYPWNKFTQESGWGKSVDQATILSNVATIRLKFTGTPGITGEFNIRSIGRLGTCN